HCPTCGDIDHAKRHQRADLRGRRALVTGGRIKIGFALALRLLRDGAHVAITTRFADDAKRRFAAEPDIDGWSDRLDIHGLDLANLPSLLGWLDARHDTWPHLDIVVNNAAQTVRRPASYYARWALAESAPLMLASHEPALERSSHELDSDGLPLDLRRTNS